MAGGKDLVPMLHGSRKKTLLLEYLLLHRGRAIAAAELFALLGPGQENKNPESALKTLVSRLRAWLDESCLPRAIVTSGGGYAWNFERYPWVDVHEFEASCQPLLARTVLTDAAVRCFEEAMRLYAGDLLPHAALESWVAQKSAHYHALYLQMAERYAAMLTEAGRYAEVARVCRAALEVDALAPALNLALITALMQLGKSAEALERYHLATGTQNVQPPQDLVACYQKLIALERSSTEEIAAVRDALQSAPRAVGALVCDYAIFQDVYHLHMSNLARLGAPMFLALIALGSVSGEAIEPLVLDKAMRVLQETLRHNLRCGDTIARRGPSQFALLLPMVNADTARTVLERVRKHFYAACPFENIALNYQCLPLEQHG